LSSINVTFLSPQQAELLYNDRNLDELVDPWLGSTYNGHQMQAMISAAALCMQKSSHCQPKISEVSLIPRKADLQLENLDQSLLPHLLAYPKAVNAKV
jgi:hypothetical protein